MMGDIEWTIQSGDCSVYLCTIQLSGSMYKSRWEPFIGLVYDEVLQCKCSGKTIITWTGDKVDRNLLSHRIHPPHADRSCCDPEPSSLKS